MMLITPSDSYHYSAEYPNCTAWQNCTMGTLDNLRVFYSFVFAFVSVRGWALLFFPQREPI